MHSSPDRVPPISQRGTLQQPDPQPSPPQKPRWPWIVVAVVLGFLLIISNLDPTPSPSSADATAAQPESGLNLSQKSIPDFEAWQARESAAARPAPPASTGPVTSFGEGTYRVGEDIMPGTYRAPGTSGNCYWERAKDTEGGSDSIISNHWAPGPSVVTISPSDAVFQSQRCGTWQKVD